MLVNIGFVKHHNCRTRAPQGQDGIRIDYSSEHRWKILVARISPATNEFWGGMSSVGRLTRTSCTLKTPLERQIDICTILVH
jgi:hypothetical protein